MKNYLQIIGFSKYRIYKNGKVWSDHRHRYLIPQKTVWGYYRTTLKGDDGKFKGFSIHRLVAEAFMPNPLNKEEVNHIDCNKTNNNVENLEWCTPSENLYHSYKMNRRSAVGENNARAILNVKQVKLFRLLYEYFKWSCSKISTTFNVNKVTVGNVIYYKHWKNV